MVPVSMMWARKVSLPTGAFSISQTRKHRITVRPYNSRTRETRYQTPSETEGGIDRVDGEPIWGHGAAGVRIAAVVGRWLSRVMVAAVLLAGLSSAGCSTSRLDDDQLFLGVSRDDSGVRVFVLACELLPTSVLFLSTLGQASVATERAFEDVWHGRSSPDVDGRTAEYRTVAARSGAVLELPLSDGESSDDSGRMERMLGPRAETLVIFVRDRSPGRQAISSPIDTSSIPTYPSVKYTSFGDQADQTYRSPRAPTCS